MKSSVLSAKEFFQLTVNALLELCTHCIDGHSIVNIEGRLLLTLDTGDKVELNILQQDVGNISKSVTDDDTNASASAVISNKDKKEPTGIETTLTADDSVCQENLDNLHAHQTDMLDSPGDTELHSTCADDDDQWLPNVDSMPTAVLGINGEFTCSSCGETTKCARAIKRHMSTHMSLLESLEPSTSPCHEIADDASKDNETQKWLKKEVTRQRRASKAESSNDSDKQWRTYVCKECDITCTSRARLDLHVVQMHRPHKCQKCGTVLSGRRNFSQHVRNEHPGLHICKAQKSFVCEYCSRTFHDESLLKDHILTVHLGAIEHRCDECGKVLGSAITLQIHQRQLHERRFQQTCDGCGRQFTRLAGLINHLSRTHPHLLPDKYRRRLEKFSCKECDSRFLRYSLLKHHREIRHGGAPKYMCSICSRRFSCQRYVFRHVRLHHPGTIHTASFKSSAVVVDIGNEDSTSVSGVLQQPADVTLAQ